MTKTKRRIFTILICLITSMLLIFGNSYLLPIFNFFNKDKITNAYNQSETITVSGGDFSTTSTNYPATSSNWTKCSKDSTNIVSGIINLSETTYNNNYKNTYKLPDSLKLNTFNSVYNDNYVLMINDTSISTYSNKSKFYYTSSTITLDANSFYVLSISATALNAAFKIELSEGTEPILTQTSSSSAWNEYKFYVQTSTTQSTSISFKVYLNSKEFESTGAVFFDNLECKKIGESEYNATKVEENSKKLNETIDVTNRITNANIENNDGFTQTTASTNSKITTINSSDTHNNNSTKILQLKSENETYISFESDNFILKQNEILKVSFWSKTDCESTASILLDSFLDENGDEIEENVINKPEKASLTISKTESGTATKGWTNHTFVITGHPWADASLKLVFEMGSETKNTKGQLLIDDITCELLTSAQKTASEKLSNVLKVETQSFKENSIKNGTFNFASEISYDVTDSSVSYPLAPKDWIIEKSSESDYIGIINEKNRPSTIPHPDDILYSGIPSRFNNYLAIQSSSKASVKSASFDLSATSYYEINVTIQTKDFAQAEINVIANNVIYAQKQNIKTNEIWQTITFYIQTSTFALSPSVEIVKINGVGTVYVDDVNFKTITQETYSTKTETNNNLIFDFSIENFNIKSEQYVGSLKSSNAQAEVSSNIETTDSNNYLAIRSLSEKVYYTKTSANSFSINPETYYKLSLKCKVSHIEGSGASISITNFDDAYTGITSTDGEWKEYIFFLKTSESTSFNIILSLGNSEQTSSGIAMFDDIILEKLADENSFTTQFISAKESRANVKKILNVVEIPAKTEEETTPEEPKVKYNFDWLWIPSLILGLALVIAIVGVSIKSIKIKPKKKIKQESYDKERIMKKEKRKSKKQKFIDFITTEDENENNNK